MNAKVVTARLQSHICVNTSGSRWRRSPPANAIGDVYEAIFHANDRPALDNGLLILAAYLTAEGGRHVRLDPPSLHFLTGFAVLLLVLPRMVWRPLVGAPPAISHGLPVDFAAKIVHAALYMLIIALPLTGWYAASKLGVIVELLGFKLPALVGSVQSAPGLIAELHERWQFCRDSGGTAYGCGALASIRVEGWNADANEPDLASARPSTRIAGTLPLFPSGLVERQCG